MFVYLSHLNNATFVGIAESPSLCRVEKDWTLLMALESPSHLVQKIASRWKRESRGAASRVTKGFKLSDEHMLRVRVSNVPLGVLSEVNTFARKEGRIMVPSSFWEQL